MRLLCLVGLFTIVSACATVEKSDPWVVEGTIPFDGSLKYRN